MSNSTYWQLLIIFFIFLSILLLYDPLSNTAFVVGVRRLIILKIKVNVFSMEFQPKIFHSAMTVLFLKGEFFILTR